MVYKGANMLKPQRSVANDELVQKSRLVSDFIACLSDRCCELGSPFVEKQPIISLIDECRERES